MSQHDQIRPPGTDFVGGKAAPEHGRHAEELEEIRRDACHRDFARVAALPERENPAEKRLEERDVLDDGALVAQLRQVGPRHRKPIHVEDRSVVTPDVVEVAGIPVRHRLDQDLVNERVHDGDHAEPDGQRADRDHGKRPCPQQPARRGLDVAAPIAVAAPRDGGPHAFAGAVAQRVRERAHPENRKAQDASAPENLARAVAIGFDDRVAHVVTEVGRIETLEEAEPALGHVDEAIADHDLEGFESRPPRRATRVNVSSRLASAEARRRPASVML